MGSAIMLFYPRLGFERRESNVYRMMLREGY
jgi:hypothetical protein